MRYNKKTYVEKVIITKGNVTCTQGMIKGRQQWSYKGLGDNSTLTFSCMGVSSPLNFWVELPNILSRIHNTVKNSFLEVGLRLSGISALNKLFSQSITEDKSISFETSGVTFVFCFAPQRTNFYYDENFKFLRRFPLGYMNTPRDVVVELSTFAPCRICLEDGHYYFRPSLKDTFDLIHQRYREGIPLTSTLQFEH